VPRYAHSSPTARVGERRKFADGMFCAFSARESAVSGRLTVGRVVCMNVFSFNGCVVGRLVWLALAACLMAPVDAAVAIEETFDVLEIGTKTYKNVTVTTKAKNYIFILHSAGMTNLKIAELPPDVQAKLGYGEKPKAETNSLTSWAKGKMAKLELPRVKQLQQRWGGEAAGRFPMMAAMSPRMILPVLGAALILYLFFCYCCSLICQKSRKRAGALVWVPVLQLLPLLRAARMSRWWFLAWFVPGLNLVAQILWSVKIVQARAMSGWVAVFLLLPLTSLFAFLYLAFQAAPPKEEEPAVEIMTLDAA
jgi:hypothetical protein